MRADVSGAAALVAASAFAWLLLGSITPVGVGVAVLIASAAVLLRLRTGTFAFLSFLLLVIVLGVALSHQRAWTRLLRPMDVSDVPAMLALAAHLFFMGEMLLVRSGYRVRPEPFKPTIQGSPPERTVLSVIGWRVLFASVAAVLVSKGARALAGILPGEWSNPGLARVGVVVWILASLVIAAEALRRLWGARDPTKARLILLDSLWLPHRRPLRFFVRMARPK